MILSGHLHINQTAVKTAANTNNTILVEPGAYGEYVARLDLKVDKTSGKINSYTTTNVLIDDTISGNAWMNSLVNVVNSSLNTALVPAFNALFGSTSGVSSILDTVAINDAPINDTSLTSGFTVGESVLGNLTADSYRNAINGIWAQAYADSGGTDLCKCRYGCGNRRRQPRSDCLCSGRRNSRPPGCGGWNYFVCRSLQCGASWRRPLDSSALGYPLLTTYIKALIFILLSAYLYQWDRSDNSDYYINFAGIYVHVIANLAHSLTGLGYDVYLCPTGYQYIESELRHERQYSNGSAGTFINPGNTTISYKISTDLYTLMMMYEVEYISSYVINTYDVRQFITSIWCLPAIGFIQAQAEPPCGDGSQLRHGHGRQAVACNLQSFQCRIYVCLSVTCSATTLKD